MKFKFIGDPKNDFSGPDECVIHGVKLYRHEFTDIFDTALAKRLMRHSHVASEGELIEAQEPETPQPKKRGGWPKGKPRKVADGT